MKQKVIQKLQQLSHHKHIELTSRGDTAIFAALYSARKQTDLGTVLIPGDGGWLTYSKYPKMLEMKVQKVKTIKAKIDLDDLKEKAKDPDVKILLYQDLAGYFAMNDIKKIYGICKNNNIFIILDITASLGINDFSQYCDISLSSFGRWKPVNLKYGGFLSTDRDYFEHNEIFNTTSFDDQLIAPLNKRLELLPERQRQIRKTCKKVKQDLKDYDVFHRYDESLVVVVGFKDDKEKENIINYCENNNYQYTMCPRYIRVNEDAVSIEVKRKEFE